ncbi:signal recognition particle-docking protein FtsY [Mannheimia granulomatis]|uniref:Signal recognition particle receptor FtsY n=1 Tax=Mannheimia granulomatis TaxID=85402 RepID=A0A6G8JG94_9PAST|nr:signal recognition particle-docking protein FtsY [Mannheimia granulomatis]QIM66096.1 signal recognition particle-docking protein FtsY [Mannheimia granulomatis]
MSEKKKGFWSWFGLGKKDPQQEEQKVEQRDETQLQPVQDEQTQIQEQEFEPSLIEKVEEKFEHLEEKFDDFIEEKEEKIEQFVEQIEDKLEQKSEQVADFIEDKVEEAKAFFNDVEEKIEEEGEQAVENLQNFANEELALHEQQQLTEQVEEAVEAELVEQASEEEIVKNSEVETIQDEYQEKPSKGGFFNRLIQGLIKTKQNIGSGFRNFFSGKKIDDELFEELEEQLLVADLGMPTTQKIIHNLTQHATKQQLKDADLLYQQLKIELGEVLKPVAQPLVIEPKKPYVILMVGVNGVGKTTTIGKLARKFQNEGKSVMLAAGDTFRAAAVEQLQVWGERNNIPVVAQSTGSDSASVIFDAMQSAAAKGIDILIADTAGRLQNKNNLMDELKKIVRVMKKYDETAPHEIMLTLDAGTGQNAISQAKLFNEAVGLTGITLTKLDGTAKGGVIFAIADQFNIPIRFIGVGEKIEDLRPFNAEEFIEALFSHEDENND